MAHRNCKHCEQLNGIQMIHSPDRISKYLRLVYTIIMLSTAVGIMVTCFNTTASAQDVIVKLGDEQIIAAISVDSSAQNTADKQWQQDFKNDLRHAMNLTGIFKLLSQAQLLPNLKEEGFDKTDFDAWHASAAQALIKARIRPVGGQYSFEFKLYDVADTREIAVGYRTMTLSSKRYRDAINAFINAVVGYYTGTPGFLGSRILVVQKLSRSRPSRVASMGIDGTGLSRITSDKSIAMLPAWGPNDGVLLTSYRAGKPDVWLAAGGKMKNISRWNTKY